MIKPARVALRADRWNPFAYVIAFRGVDLTGADLHAQVRLGPDAPGAPLLDLALTNNAAAQGVRLMSVDTTGTLPVSYVRLQVPAAALGDAMPPGPELGDDYVGAWDLLVTLPGRTRAPWLHGDFVVAAGVSQLGDAPLAADPPPGTADAWVEVDAAALTVEIAGADAIAPAIDLARSFADRAKSFADAAAATIAALPAIQLYPSAFTREGYPDASGDFRSTQDWLSTGYIETAKLSSVALRLYGNPSVRSVAFWGQGKNALTGAAVAQADGDYLTAMPDIPEGAYYVTFTARFGIGDQSLIAALDPATLSQPLDLVQRVDVTALPTVSGYLNTAGVLVGPDPNWLTSAEFIPVAPGSSIGYHLEGHASVATIAVFDADQKFLASQSLIGASSPVQLDGSLAFSPDAAFFKLCRPSAAFQSVGFPSSAVYAFSDQRALSSQAEGGEGLPPLLPGTQKVSVDVSRLARVPGYYDHNGVFKSDQNWETLAHYRCAPGDTVSVHTMSHPALQTVSFWDGKETFLPSTGATPSEGAPFDDTVTAPTGTRSFRISQASAARRGSFVPVLTAAVSLAAAGVDLLATATGVSSTAPVPFAAPRARLLTSSSVIVTSGDSRSSTDYADYKAAYQALTAASCQTLGISGSTAAQQATASYLSTIYAAAPDVLIHLPGGNDIGAPGSVGSFGGVVAGEPIVAVPDITAPYAGTVYIQALYWLMASIKAHYYGNLRARAGVASGDDEATLTGKMDAISKPLIVLNTDLPQQRYDATNPTALSANWLRKADAAIEVGRLLGIHTVDTMRLAMGQWTMSVEPFYHEPTDKVHTFGSFTRDGLHPSKVGFQILAEWNLASAGFR